MITFSENISVTIFKSRGKYDSRERCRAPSTLVLPTRSKYYDLEIFTRWPCLLIGCKQPFFTTQKKRHKRQDYISITVRGHSSQCCDIVAFRSHYNINIQWKWTMRFVLCFLSGNYLREADFPKDAVSYIFGKKNTETVKRNEIF